MPDVMHLNAGANSLALAKTLLIRKPTDGDEGWEASWGEGSARCHYIIPTELAVTLLTVAEVMTPDDWKRVLRDGLGVDESEAGRLFATFREEGLLVAD